MGRDRERLAEDLRRLGVVSGELLYVHSSLKKVGWLENGADDVIDALSDVLGPGGTLAAPTHSLSYAALGRAPFTPDAPAPRMGAVPNALLRRSDAMRSRHPSHSSVAVGARARALTENHCLTQPFDCESPLRRVMEWGGRILLLGVGHTANTSLHLAESLARVPYVALHYDASWGDAPAYVDGQGAVIEVPQSEYPGCSDSFYRIEGIMKRRGALAYGAVGEAAAQIMRSRDLIETAMELLREDAAFFLCHHPKCPCCPRRRAFLLASRL